MDDTLISEYPNNFFIESEAISSLFDNHFKVAFSECQLVDSFLSTKEYEFISHATEKRRAEFGSGRLCARKTIEENGIKCTELLNRKDRSPDWPDSIIGSISHSDTHCLAVSTHKGYISGVGVDIESNKPLPENVYPTICTDDERKWLNLFPTHKRLYLAKLIFSAKEAFYKSQYRVLGRFIDFPEVSMSFDYGTFKIQSLSFPDHYNLKENFYGNFFIDEKIIVSVGFIKRI